MASTPSTPSPEPPVEPSTETTSPSNATETSAKIYQMRYLRKDIGVGIVVAIGLLIGFVLFRFVDSRVKTFAAQDIPFSLTYPSGWVPVESLLDQPLLKVEDPTTPSAFKSGLTVDMRELDPATPPTLQELLDRRVEQRSALTAYHFLSSKETNVAGEKAIQYDYAYVVQPFDQPRRAANPVVVVAREYIVTSKDRVYYITLTAPESEQNRVESKFAQVLNSVKLQ